MADIQIKDTIEVATDGGGVAHYEIVGIAEDPDTTKYFVGYSENENNFTIFNGDGNILTDETLARSILDDFTTYINNET